MADARKLEFAPFAPPAKGVLIVFCDEGVKFGPATRKLLAPTGDLLQRSAAADRFTGKNGSALDIVAPAGLSVARLTVMGVGKADKLKVAGFRQARRRRHGQGPRRGPRQATIFAEFSGGSLKPDQAAEIALGTQLRAYVFDRYKTKRKEGEDPPSKVGGHHRRWQFVCRSKGLDAARGAGRGRRDHGAGPRSTSPPTCSTPRNSPAGHRCSRSLASAVEVLRRAGDEEARHECAARGWARIAQGQPRRHHALERRQEERCARRLHRQGRDASTPAVFRSSPLPGWRT